MPQAGQPLVAQGQRAHPNPRLRMGPPGLLAQPTRGREEGIAEGRGIGGCGETEEGFHQLAGVAPDPSSLAGRSGDVDTDAHQRT